MKWLLPDQKKLALSGACRDLPVTFGDMPYLVAIEQQCFERIRDAAALVSNYFLKSTLNEGERIARAGVQTNNVYMDMHVWPVSRQTAKKCSICMLT